ncbi:MAG: hypothetical protein AABY22_12470 [Nanoarchaeota archaeon]
MKIEKTTEEKLADFGIRQFVRNTICKVLLSSDKSEESEQIIDDINEKLLKEFREIAKDESKKVFQELKEKLK